MAEKVYISDRNSAEHFAIVAGVLAERRHGKEVFGLVGRGFVEVELLIDGVAVSFTEAIDDIYKRLHEQVDKLAAQKAVLELDLTPITNLVQALEEHMYEKIAETFNVDVQHLKDAWR